MYIAGVREFRSRPRDAALLPTGELLIQSWSAQGLHLAAYDTDLALLWGRPLGENALGLNVDRQGTPWVLDRSGAAAYTREGDVAGRTEPWRTAMHDDRGPIHAVAAHPGGAFLVGYQGYVAFETVPCDRAGNRKTSREAVNAG